MIQPLRQEPRERSGHTVCAGLLSSVLVGDTLQIYRIVGLPRVSPTMVQVFR